MTGDTVASLSSREIEALNYASRGLDYKQTADKMQISPSGVKSMLLRAYEKLGVSDRLNAIIITLSYLDGPTSYTQPYRALTDDETRVRDLLLLGCTNKQISQRLGMSENTVKKRVSSLCTIYSCNNREHLVATILKFRLH